MFKKDFPCTDSFLSKYIDSISLLVFDAVPESGILQLPPLGFPVLQFHFGKRANFYNQPQLKDEALLIGQLSRHVVLRPVSGSALIGVNFKPYGLHNLLGISVDVLTDAGIDASIAFGQEFVQEQLKRLYKCTSDNQRVDLMTDFLRGIYPGFKQRKNCVYDAVVDDLVIRHGLVSLDSILSNAVKRRNLERYFQSHIGVSPKSFIQILRHKFVLGKLHERPDFRWDDPLLDGFYYDQSHFDRDFLKFSTQRPIEYLKALDNRVKLFL